MYGRCDFGQGINVLHRLRNVAKQELSDDEVGVTITPIRKRNPNPLTEPVGQFYEGLGLGELRNFPGV